MKELTLKIPNLFFMEHFKECDRAMDMKTSHECSHPSEFNAIILIYFKAATCCRGVCKPTRC